MSYAKVTTRSENLDLSLSVPHHYNNNGYVMNDQTFHTPSFGDEEFDIPPLHMQQQQQMSGIQHHQQHLHQYTQHHHAPQVRPAYMGMINPAQDGLSLPDGQPSYQQPLYLQPQEHPMHNTYGSGQPPGNYLIQQQPGGPRLLVMQPPQQPGYGRSPPQPSPAAPAAIADPHTTTSEDSDDSTPHHAPMVGVGSAVKRPSPEPAGTEPHQMPKQLAKKPKVQKKKKKRDPNEPQKPVSAYALFFRDTQAAIKGQNPNASFGEVSKIVASMWDGLDSEHKSVYKQKTEAAKKEYLKALAAYRASLVSKGGAEGEGNMYGAAGGNTGSGPYGGFYPGTAAGPGQGYGGGQSPPAPPRSPLVSPPHHLSMIGMHHAPMGPPPHHHHQQQPYMHHPHPQQPLSSPHQSPQHHMPPGPMGPQAQHMGQQGPPMGNQVQPIGSQGQQLSQSGQSPQQINHQGQQMNQQGQQMNQQVQQMGQQAQQLNQQQINQQSPPLGQQAPQMGPQNPQINQQQQQQMVQQGQQINQQNQQMCPQNQGMVQNHQMGGQNQQMRSPQGQNVGGMPNHQSPPQNGQQNPHQIMNSHPQHNGQQQQQQQQQQQPNGTPEGGALGQGRTAACIRHGCTNPAIANSEWEDEYCSNECVVSHCRDVFSSWVASNNNQSQSYSAVK